MRYCTYAQFTARVGPASVDIPIGDNSEPDQARVEALLDDAGAWLVARMPAHLIKADKTLVALADLPAALTPVLVMVSAQLVEHWLTPPKYRQTNREARLAASLLGIERHLYTIPAATSS